MSNWSDRNKKEFAKLYKKFEAISVQAPKFLEAFLLKMARKALAKTMQRTPVRTGRLKRSWRLSEVQLEGKTLVVYIENDARDDGQAESYATYVEYGTRKSEGRFMATISIAEVQKEIPARFQAELAKWLKEMGL